MSNAPNASGLSGTSAPPAIAASISPARIAPTRLADRDGARRARVRGRQDRAADSERDPQVGRGRAAEHGQGERRADRPDPALQVALVLLLGIGDPAECAADEDPDPLRLGSTGAPGRQARVRQGLSAGDEAELAEPIELAGGLRVHVVERLEVVDLGRDLRAERRRVESIDPTDRGAPRPKAGPEGVDARADRRDQADAGDPDGPLGRSARWVMTGGSSLGLNGLGRADRLG